MKLKYNLLLTFLFSMNTYSAILISYPDEQIDKKKFVENFIQHKLNISKKLVKFLKSEKCHANESYDIVICIDKKSGELKFPTYKSDLIAKKYEFFLNN